MSDTVNVPYVNIAAQHASIKDELLEALGRVIDHGKFILGGEVADFERDFAELCRVRHSVGVNSGTDALILSLRALGIGPGDEVITTPNAFVSCTSCITLVGARPVFVDVGDDYNIDPGKIDEAITPRTRAILVVHLTGRPADMEAILGIAQARGLHVIEDCAQAVCARYDGRSVGSFGTIGCFSLHPLKTLSACGDGGMITTDDDDLCEELKLLRNLGLRNRDECVLWTSNSRLDTLQAAILQVKLKYLDQWTEKRRENARFYQEHLSDLEQVSPPVDKGRERAVYHTFVIQADRRDDLREYLAQRGVGTAVHYPIPLHLQPAAEGLGWGPGSFPAAEAQAARILSLPVYPELAPGQLEYVVECIHDFYLAKGK